MGEGLGVGECRTIELDLDLQTVHAEVTALGKGEGVLFPSLTEELGHRFLEHFALIPELADTLAVDMSDSIGQQVDGTEADGGMEQVCLMSLAES